MQRSRAGLFLMELTIALFFFTIACAVCINLFVKAHSLNEDNSHKAKAKVICDNIAEEYRSGVSVDELKAGSYSGYSLKLDESGDGYVDRLVIEVIDEDTCDIYYTLTVDRHISLSVDNSESNMESASLDSPIALTSSDYSAGCLQEVIL